MLESFSTTAHDPGHFTHVDLRLAQGACPHCSSEWQAVFHSGRCPEIKAIEYDASGRIKRIEYRDVGPVG
jgi:hypothetical protein